MNDTITEVNTPRLVQLARWLTHEERKRRLGQPSEWEQGVWIRTRKWDDVEQDTVTAVEVQNNDVFWSCGTACCLAGHVALEDGGRPAFQDRLNGGYVPVPIDGDLSTLSEASMFFGNRHRPIDEYAAEALGLDSYNADRLFEGGNGYDTVIELISEFTDIDEQQLLRMVGGLDLPPDPDYADEEDDSDTW